MTVVNREELKNQLVKLRDDGFYGEKKYSDYLYQVLGTYAYKDKFGDKLIIVLKHHSRLPGKRGSGLLERDFNCGETVHVELKDLIFTKSSHVTETTVNKFMRKC